MRAHTFPKQSGKVAFRGVVQALDQRTRAEGFHVLQGWDPMARAFPDDIAPVLMLDYCSRVGIRAGAGREALAILLDYYFLSVLSLFAVRAWDQDDLNTKLDDVTRLFGSCRARGEVVAGSWTTPTLLLLAISHYHPQDAAYDDLMRKVLAARRGVSIEHGAPGCGHSGQPSAMGLSAHVSTRRRPDARRQCGRLSVWLLFSVLTLTRAYAAPDAGASAATDRGRVGGPSAERAYGRPVGICGPVASCRATEYRTEHQELRDRLHAQAGPLVADVEIHRPDPHRVYAAGISVQLPAQCGNGNGGDHAGRRSQIVGVAQRPAVLTDAWHRRRGAADQGHTDASNT